MTRIPKRELGSATTLIRELSTGWDFARYHDTYTEQVLRLIDQKARSKKVPTELPEEPQADVIDLMSALERSIEQAKGGGDTAGSGQRKRGTSRSRVDELSKAELSARAGDLDISDRSQMSKDELRRAVKEAS